MTTFVGRSGAGAGGGGGGGGGIRNNNIRTATQPPPQQQKGHDPRRRGPMSAAGNTSTKPKTIAATMGNHGSRSNFIGGQYVDDGGQLLGKRQSMKPKQQNSTVVSMKQKQQNMDREVQQKDKITLAQQSKRTGEIYEDDGGQLLLNRQTMKQKQTALVPQKNRTRPEQKQQPQQKTMVGNRTTLIGMSHSSQAATHKDQSVQKEEFEFEEGTLSFDCCCEA